MWRITSCVFFGIAFFLVGVNTFVVWLEWYEWGRSAIISMDLFSIFCVQEIIRSCSSCGSKGRIRVTWSLSGSICPCVDTERTHFFCFVYKRNPVGYLMMLWVLLFKSCWHSSVRILFYTSSNHRRVSLRIATHPFPPWCISVSVSQNIWIVRFPPASCFLWCNVPACMWLCSPAVLAVCLWWARDLHAQRCRSSRWLGTPRCPQHLWFLPGESTTFSIYCKSAPTVFFLLFFLTRWNFNQPIAKLVWMHVVACKYYHLVTRVQCILLSSFPGLGKCTWIVIQWFDCVFGWPGVEMLFV